MVGNCPSSSNSYNTKTLILQGFAHRAVTSSLVLIVVLRTVDENADSWNALALVVEVGLNGNAESGRMLRMIRKAQLILIKIVEKGNTFIVTFSGVTNLSNVGAT